MKYDVFISYSRKDYVDEQKNVIHGNVISIIKDTLQRNGITYWIDEEGDLTGKKFANIIACKIRESMSFLFVCTNNSVASKWVDRELSVADEHSKHIIPFICDDSYKDDKVIMFTAALDRIEYYTNPQKELEKLVLTIQKDKEDLVRKEKEDLKKQHEEEELRQKKEEEARVKKAKEEIKELATAYKMHTFQQEIILRQLYEKNHDLGNDCKQCLVCETSNPIGARYCRRCGWHFPELFCLDGCNTNDYDASQLKIARTNWKTYGRAVELLLENKTLMDENVNIRHDISELRNKYLLLLKNQGREEEIKQKENIVFNIRDVEFTMVYVEGGRFQMGSPDNDGDAYDDEKPLHWVGLPDYYIGETVVTRALWKAVMLGYRTLPNGDDLPVTNNKWNSTSNLEGVQDFINRLNKALQDKLPQGRHFRLPTEAEWEYAARGGKKSHGYKYSGSNDIDDVAWYEGNSNGEIHPVKTKKPNELGLYNMSGNVWEWCHNMFESYRIEEEQGVQLVSRRVYRGGSWYDTARGCRVVHRGYAPGNHGKQGFRLVLA